MVEEEQRRDGDEGSTSSSEGDTCDSGNKGSSSDKGNHGKVEREGHIFDHWQLEASQTDSE